MKIGVDRAAHFDNLTPVKTKFNNASGTLTYYGFRCGYIEKKELKDGSWVELYLDGCWHVRKFNKLNERLVWDSPENLTEARKLYRKLQKVEK